MDWNFRHLLCLSFFFLDPAQMFQVTSLGKLSAYTPELPAATAFRGRAREAEGMGWIGRDVRLRDWTGSKTGRGVFGHARSPW